MRTGPAVRVPPSVPARSTVRASPVHCPLAGPLSARRSPSFRGPLSVQAWREAPGDAGGPGERCNLTLLRDDCGGVGVPAWLAFVGLGGAQLIIFWVMRLFVRRAVVGEPPKFLRLVVAATGIIAALFLLAGAYLYFLEPLG